MKAETAVKPRGADASELSVFFENECLFLVGELTVWTLRLLPPTQKVARIDLAGLTRMDTAGAWELVHRRAAGSVLTGLVHQHASLLQTVSDALPISVPKPQRRMSLTLVLDTIGRSVTDALVYLGQLTEYLGRTLSALGWALRHPTQFPLTSLTHHCQETGLRAVPIVAVMSFLIGVVIGFQGADQLRQFGAEIFVVDLIAISILRELGILLTAIIVAGRTASALTASLGSMKMRQEIDAMRTLGLDPDLVLVLPRVLALVLMLPILGLFSALFGLLGGAMLSWIELGQSPVVFLARLSEVDVSHAVVGMIKAPVFALIIGVIGCHAGMHVGNDTEALGRMTSAAVVSAIFAVIIADAAFSVFFAKVGL